MRLRDIMSKFSFVIKRNNKIDKTIVFWYENDMPLIIPVLGVQNEIIDLINWKDILYLEQCKNNNIWETTRYIDNNSEITVSSVRSELPSAKQKAGWWIMASADDRMENIFADQAQWVIAVDEKNYPVGFIARDRWLESIWKNAEAQRKMIKDTLDWTHNAIVVVDSVGKIIIFNQAAEKYFGYKQNDVIGRHADEFPIKWEFLSVLKTGFSYGPKKLQLGKFHPPKTLIIKNDPIIVNGEIIGAVAIFQDVTEIEHAAFELDSLKSLNKELESFIEASFDGILISDLNGKILKTNSAFQQLLEKLGFDNDMADITSQRMEQYGVFSSSLLNKITTSKEQKSCSLVINEHEILITGNPVWTEKNQTSFDKILFNYRDVTTLNKLRKDVELMKNEKEYYKNELNNIKLQLNYEENFIVRSSVMEEVLETVLMVSSVESTVLLLGESGVGKDVIARLIHENSNSYTGKLVKINCGAVPENLLESELFGYEPGSFSGASKEGKMGRFELAQDGTLFLDEISEMPLSLQVKLLQVIQDRVVFRIGGTKPKKINVRILAATNQDLAEKVKEGSFRQDLYFRLNVIPIKLPSLRERKEDIIPLAQYFLEKFNSKYNYNKVFDDAILNAFLQYDWPGNVRELENIVERMVVTTRTQVISEKKLTDNMLLREDDINSPSITVNNVMPLKDAVDEVEKQIISKAMDKFGSTHKASKVLGVDPSTVARKLRKLRH